MKLLEFMKTEILKIKWLLPACLLMLLAAASCVDDNAGNGSGIGKEKTVTFCLTLPGQSSAGSTYALSTSDEEDVKSIEVLLFAAGGNYMETRAVPATAISGTGNVKIFTVKIPEGTYSSLVILANSYDIVFNAGLLASDTKAAALTKLDISNPTKWVTDNTSGSYKVIPMWGELGSTTVNQATSKGTLSMPWSLNLTRMLAKVSVWLTTPAATGSFELQSIRVYNYYNKGSVAPVAANWGSGIATDASVPSGAAKPAVTTPYTTLTYSGAEITTTDVSSINEIYLFESDNSLQSDLNVRTCLVLGGTYSDGQVYYYRVDFVDNTSGADIYLDILRNHHYKFNVTKISGPGYDTPDKAFSVRPFNIEATVIAWNDTDINNVATDGQYMLGVSRMEYNLAMDAYISADSDNKLTVTTDHPSGWVISSIIDDATGTTASWLNIATGDMSGGTTKKTIFLLLDRNSSGSVRSARVSVKAGTITLAVQVNQSQETNLGLSIKDNAGINDIAELIFYAPAGTPPAAQQFVVSWAPKVSECSVISNMMGTVAFNYGSGDILGTGGFTQTTGGGTGIQTFSIAPPAISASDIDPVSGNPFLERVSKVDFTITNGISYISKSIFLRQVNYALTTAGTAAFYMLNGSTYSFKVKSNAPWRVRSVTETVTSGSGTLLNINAGDNLKVGTAGGNNITVGDDISFTVANNISSLSGMVTVVFENMDSPKKFSDVSLTLTLMGEYYPAAHSGWAGSNIYWDGTKLTFDDVGVQTNEKYQGVYFKWGSLWGISPSGNWTDNSTVVYKPNGGGYIASTAATWDAIPFWEPGTITANRDLKYLTETVHSTANTASGYGDICKYLTGQAGGTLHGKKWRLPTSNEFNSVVASESSLTDLTSGNNTDYTWSWTGTAGTANANGTATFLKGVRKSEAGGTPFFPAAGYRHSNSGTLFFVDVSGHYWSSSPSGALGYYLYFNRGSVIPAANYTRAYGFTVRCVAE